MFYATWSKGFRPGGINRQPGLAPYNPDFLINYELGWKTSLGPLRWNGAVYHQLWKKFQFSFLGENSLTVVQNGRDATINGIETDINYVRGGLTLDCGGGLHRRQDQGQHLRGRGRSDAQLRRSPGCRRSRRSRAMTNSSHHRAERHAPAGHAEIQDHGHGALHLGHGAGQGARADRRRSPGFGAVGA